MLLACSCRAEANTIWQRRKTNADDERNPAWIVSRSSGVSGRMKMGAFIPVHIGFFPHFLSSDCIRYLFFHRIGKVAMREMVRVGKGWLQKMDTLRNMDITDPLLLPGWQKHYEQTLEDAYAALAQMETTLDGLVQELEFQHQLLGKVVAQCSVE